MERLRPRTLLPSSPDLATDDLLIELVKQLQARILYDENAAVLYRTFQPRIYYFFLRKDFTREESGDLTQEVFLRVFKGIGTFRGASRFEFERWLAEITDHIFFNEVRRRRAEMRYGAEYSLDAKPKGGEGKALAEQLQDEEPTPDDVFLRRQSRALLLKAIETLPEQMRRCCTLRHKHNLKYKDIAAEMGISIETVKAHLHQARLRLTELLGGGLGLRKGVP